VVLLEQIAPGVSRAAVVRDPSIGSGTVQFAVIQSVAPSFGVEVYPINVRDASTSARTLSTSSVMTSVALSCCPKVVARSNRSAACQPLAIRDLLTMTSGFGLAAPLEAMAGVPPPEMWQWKLNPQTQHAPGAPFNYDDDAVDPLSVAPTRALPKFMPFGGEPHATCNRHR
jgi:hypothetical protein